VKGGKPIRLPGNEGSAEFNAAYDELLAQARISPAKGGRPPNYLKPRARRLVSNANGVKRFHPPAIGWFIEQWLASDFFALPDKAKPKDKPLRPGTQQ